MLVECKLYIYMSKYMGYIIGLIGIRSSTYVRDAIAKYVNL